MPVLSNPKHELFAQELAKGKTQKEAYETAGYTPSEPNASRLTSNEKVSARVVELLAKVAKRAEITLHDIVDQLDEDRSFARNLDKPAPAITATMGKAKVLGFLTDKVEHTGKDGGPIETVTNQELARLLAYQLYTAAEETAH